MFKKSLFGNKSFSEYIGIVVAVLLALGFIVVVVLSGLIFGNRNDIPDYTNGVYQGIELRTPGGAVPNHPPEVMTPTYAPPSDDFENGVVEESVNEEVTD